MKLPPMWISLGFSPAKDNGDGGFKLWIPLFILVPFALIILLAFFLITLPFLLLSALFTWQVKWLRWIWFAVPALFRTMQELPGLEMLVEEEKQKIYIDIH